MQDDGAVRIEHAFWVARGAGRVAEEGAEVFVDLRPGDLVALFCDQCFVALCVDGAGLGALLVGQHDEGFHGRQLRRDALDRGEEVTIEEEDAAFGMVDRVDDLFVEQARVGGVEDGADAGDGVEEFEMAVGIPGEAGDAVAVFDAEAQKRVGGLGRAAEGAGVIVTPDWLVDEARDELAAGVGRGREFQDVDDLQRRRLHQAGGHAGSLGFFGEGRASTGRVEAGMRMRSLRRGRGVSGLRWPDLS